jgi:hypothetical protein
MERKMPCCLLGIVRVDLIACYYKQKVRDAEQREFPGPCLAGLGRSPGTAPNCWARENTGLTPRRLRPWLPFPQSRQPKIEKATTRVAFSVLFGGAGGN